MIDIIFQLLSHYGILQFDYKKVLSYLWNRSYGFWDVLYLLVILGAFFYYYGRKHRNYFNKRGIKSLPIDFPAIGHMYKVLRRQEHFKDLLNRQYFSFPEEKYVGHMQMTHPFILIRDLELIKKIAVKDFDNFMNHQVVLDADADSILTNHLFALKGDKWREMRGTLSPAFTGSKMRGMFEFIEEIGEQMTKFYLDKMEDSENADKGLVEVELKEAFTKYTNDVIATSAFGIKINSLEEPENEFYQMGMKVSKFSGIQMLKFILFSTFPMLMKLTKIPLLNEDIKNFFKDLVLNAMRTRDENEIVRQDMINLFMEARKGVEEQDGDDEPRVPKRNWTDDELVAQAVLFFIAGFDTSSVLLCFMSHELTINQDIQRKLQEEIDEIVAENGHKLDYNDLSKLKYMDMVISETLRLWPPALGTDRQCLKPYKLPPSSSSDPQGYTMKKGECIFIPIYGIHHDPQYYPEPEKFDPERFSDENKQNILPFSYLPFGVGPRMCIGNRFALMETKAVMFHLLSKFDFVQVEKTTNPLVLARDTFNMHSKDGFWIGLKPRDI